MEHAGIGVPYSSFLRGWLKPNRASFFLILLFALNVLLPLNTAKAEEGGKRGTIYPASRPLTPNDIPEDRRPIKLNMLNEADLFTGDYRYEIEIPVPPGKGSFTPSVLLKYRSGSGRTQLGMDWDLEYDYIRRSLRNGVPRYTTLIDEHPNQDPLEYKIGSEQGTLVFDRRTPEGYLYRPKREGSFLKFYYTPSMAGGETAEWTVYTPSGNVWELGKASHDYDSRHADAEDRIYAWHVSTIRDPDGNTIDYHWKMRTGHALLLDEISYNESTVKNARTGLYLGYHTNIEFDWRPAADILDEFESNGLSQQSHILSDYGKGIFESYGSWALQNIKVKGFDEDGEIESRDYELKFDQVKEIYEEQTAGPLSLVAAVPQELPFTEFTYTQPPQGFSESKDIPDLYKNENDESANVDQRTLFASRVDPDRTPGCESIGRADGTCYTSKVRMINMLVDMDGDGDLDILTVHSSLDNGDGKWRWRYNQGGFLFMDYAEVRIPSGILNPDALIYEKTIQSSIKYSTGAIFRDTSITLQSIMDMNGDGKADIVFQKSSGRSLDLYVCLGNTPIHGAAEFSACEPWFSRTWEQSAPNMSLINNAITERVSGIETGGSYTYRWQTNDLVDFSGDGLPDLVEARVGQDPQQAGTRVSMLAVYRNQGDGFFDHHDRPIPVPICDEVNTLGLAPACMRSSKSYFDKVSCGTREMVDINGDGILDLIRNRVKSGAKPFNPFTEISQFYCSSEGLDVSLGTGADFDGFMRFDVRGQSVLVTYPEDLRTQVHPVGLLSPTEGQFIDMNGDKLPDLVSFDFATETFNVSVNTGTRFSPPVTWKLCPLCEPPKDKPYNTYSIPEAAPFAGVSATFNLVSGGHGVGEGQGYGVVQALLDLNGDGQVEFVSIEQFNASRKPEYFDNTWQVYRVASWKNAPVEYLKDVSGHNGMHTHVTYTLPSDDKDNNLPSRQWAVGSILNYDMVTGTELRNDIVYTGGRWDSERHESLGYGRVEVVDGDKKVSHYFLQGEFDAGLEYRTDIFDDLNGALLRRNVTNFESYSLTEGARAWVRPRREISTIYDGGEAYRTQTEYEYSMVPDQTLGFLTRVVHNGDESSQQRVDDYKYTFTNTDTRYLLRTRSETRTDGATTPTTLSKKTYYYDGHTTLTTPPQKGKLTRSGVLYEDDGRFAYTDYVYDAYGRLTQEVLPDGEERSIFYYGSSPYKWYEENGLGHQRYFRSYHALTGKPRTACGPQYDEDGPEDDKCSKTEYDLYGRPTMISKPVNSYEVPAEEARVIQSGTLAKGEWMHYGPFNAVEGEKGGGLGVSLMPESGDPDLYVRIGQPPTLTEYDCRPDKGGISEETCIVGPGVIYVSVRGFSSAENQYTVGLAYVRNEFNEEKGVTLVGNEWQHYGPFEVGSGQFLAKLIPHSGDADLYVRRGEVATQAEYDCRPYGGGTREEICHLAAPGTFFISVHAYEQSGVSFDLQTEYTPPLGDPLLQYADEPRLTERIYYNDWAHWSATSPFESAPSVRVETRPGFNSAPRVGIAFFDGQGNVVKEAQTHSAGKMSATYFAYDKRGRLQQAARPVVEPLSYEYWPTVDGIGEKSHWRYSYDLLDRLTMVNNPDSTWVTLNYVPDNVILHTDEVGNETGVGQNRYGDIIFKSKLSDNGELVSWYDYDAAGRLTHARDPLGVESVFSYYNDGVKKRAITSTAQRSWQRTAGGKIEKEDRGGGSEISYSYDLIGRLKQRTIVSPPPAKECFATACVSDDREHGDDCNRRKEETFYYDEGTTNIGHLTRVVSIGDRSHERNFAYDALGNVAFKRNAEIGETGSTKLQYEKRYNWVGDLVEVRYGEDIGAAPSVSFRYDSMGKLSRVDSGRYGTALSADILYYPDGQVEHLLGRVEGPTTSWQFERAFQYYESTGRLRRIGSEIPNGLWISQFAYHENGKVKTHYNDIQIDQSFTREWDYQYDPAGRLMDARELARTESTNEKGPPVHIHYEYYDNGALDTVTYGGGHQVYQYDDEVQKVLSLVDSTRPQQTVTKSFKYEPNSGARCVTWMESFIQRDKSAEGSSGPFAFYEWNGDGTLHRIRSGANESHFAYDHNGVRWYADRAGYADDTWYLDEMELHEPDSGWSGPTYNVPLPGEVICTLSVNEGAVNKCSFSEGLHYMATWDGNGKVLGISEYMPYGGHYGVSGSRGADVRRFTYNLGKEREPDYGDPLMNFGARYYDPSARQFISPDPLRMDGAEDTIGGENTLQPYLYAAADPITNFDPDGAQAVKKPGLWDIASLATTTYSNIFHAVAFSGSPLTLGASVASDAFSYLAGTDIPGVFRFGAATVGVGTVPWGASKAINTMNSQIFLPHINVMRPMTNIGYLVSKISPILAPAHAAFAGWTLGSAIDGLLGLSDRIANNIFNKRYAALAENAPRTVSSDKFPEFSLRGSVSFYDANHLVNEAIFREVQKSYQDIDIVPIVPASNGYYTGSSSYSSGNSNVSTYSGAPGYVPLAGPGYN